VPFFFEPDHLIGTVYGCAGTGSAREHSYCTAWPKEHLHGATRYPCPIQKRSCCPRPAPYNASDSALNRMLDVNWLIYQKHATSHNVGAA
jgi:hypothetical protein